jgi:hypothetical protein
MQAGVSSPGSARGRLCNPRAGDDGGTAAGCSWANNAEYRCAGKTMGGGADRREIDSRWKRPRTWGENTERLDGLALGRLDPWAKRSVRALAVHLHASIHCGRPCHSSVRLFSCTPRRQPDS